MPLQQIAQTNPPPILPMGDLYPPWPLPIANGDASSGLSVFSFAGRSCEAPMPISPQQVISFFEKCTKENVFFASDGPCSCQSFQSIVSDHFTFHAKVFGKTVKMFANGTLGNILLVTIVVMIFSLICLPLVYWLSYRLSRKELMATKSQDFFLKWHTQRNSSFFCLTLIVLGGLLFLLNVNGQTEIKLTEALSINTTYPGLAMVFFGVIIWLLMARKVNPSPKKTS
jgi:hypothetical protein